MTANFRSNLESDKATLSGSSGSGNFRFPVGTSQNRQARVQVSPKIMKGRVPASQQVPILGHDADWQTVFKPLSFIRDFY
jgi:hypothetical protein